MFRSVPEYSDLFALHCFKTCARLDAKEVFIEVTFVILNVLSCFNTFLFVFKTFLDSESLKAHASTCKRMQAYDVGP